MSEVLKYETLFITTARTTRDEIHVKSKVAYAGGRIIGYADNNMTANRIQCFMLSSILSKNKDTLSLIPVKKMTSEYLTKLTKQVIASVKNAGYKIVSIISDTNIVNRKMFMELGGSDILKPFIINPINDEKIFVLFDSVHLLKCVRNN